MKKILFCNIALLAFPTSLFAAAPSDLKGLIEIFTKGLLNPIVGLLTGLAVVFFIWGIVKYIANSGDEKAAQEGKNVMIYGVLALFILFSFWGIVQLLYNSVFK
jgi:hypothetical protein